MSKTAIGLIEPQEYAENVHAKLQDGSKLSSVERTDLYQGDIEGEAVWRGINLTRADGSGTFVSVQRLICRIGDRFGSFVLELDGKFDQAGLKAIWKVVPDSGTGELRTIRGVGSFLWDVEGNSYTLNYDLD